MAPAGVGRSAVYSAYQGLYKQLPLDFVPHVRSLLCSLPTSATQIEMSNKIVVSCSPIVSVVVHLGNEVLP